MNTGGGLLSSAQLLPLRASTPSSPIVPGTAVDRLVANPSLGLASSENQQGSDRGNRSNSTGDIDCSDVEHRISDDGSGSSSSSSSVGSGKGVNRGILRRLSAYDDAAQPTVVVDRFPSTIVSANKSTSPAHTPVRPSRLRWSDEASDGRVSLVAISPAPPNWSPGTSKSRRENAAAGVAAAHEEEEGTTATLPSPRGSRSSNDRNASDVGPDDEAMETSQRIKHEAVASPSVVFPQGYARLSPLERKALASLTNLRTIELLRLQQLFSWNHVDGKLSPTAFWCLLATAAPLLVYGMPDGPLHQRMFTIFDQLKLGALTCFEFVLATAIMSGRALFLSRAVFAFDLLDHTEDQRVDAVDVHAVLGRWSAAALTADVGATDWFDDKQTTTATAVSVTSALVWRDGHGHPRYRRPPRPIPSRTPWAIKAAYATAFQGAFSGLAKAGLTRDAFAVWLTHTPEPELLLAPFSVDLGVLLAE
jgi:hypothetical protein